MAICCTLIFSLLASVGIANELDLNTGPAQINSEKNQVETEKNFALKCVENAGVVDAIPALPFLLQRGQRACLNSCQIEFETCMKSANNADSKYRCGDNRWRCTRNCDNKWYHRLQL